MLRAGFVPLLLLLLQLRGSLPLDLFSHLLLCVTHGWQYVCVDLLQCCLLRLCLSLGRSERRLSGL